MKKRGVGETGEKGRKEVGNGMETKNKKGREKNQPSHLKTMSSSFPPSFLLPTRIPEHKVIYYKRLLLEFCFESKA